ncbi:thiazole synthase [Candidatus Sumerlaeota bacterium]|nr:thiazole synthase [Candidatus Sumerlaeota bacterium]MBI3735026.1 thiazole synthase [Candidatus Sumerlaeota bacterium]
MAPTTPETSALEDTPLVIGKKSYRSRLLAGTGKYATLDLMDAALSASGAEIVTVALRRIDFNKPEEKALITVIEGKYDILPNTAGCYTKADAVKIAHLARELEIGEMLKLEVIGDPKTLLPDVVATLEATRELAKEGFTILAYTNDDPVMAMKLQDAGAAVVMPLGSPIGSGQGILNPNNIRLIMESLQVPVIVDAGVGTASDVALAMELGVGGVLLNTAISAAKEPVRMAHAMRMACDAGRQAYLAGRMPKRRYANASSPILDF